MIGNLVEIIFSVMDWILILAILIILGCIAWRDGKTRLISMSENILLIAFTIALQFQNKNWETTLIFSIMGGLLGFCIVVCKIIYDTKRNNPLSIHHGDAILFGSTGFLLGPLGLAYAFILNAPLSLTHHLFLAKKEKRSVWQGYAPVAPTFCLSVSVVFGFNLRYGGVLFEFL